MNRHDFIKSTALAATAALSGCATTVTTDEGLIMTVTGPIEPRKLGRTLMHEHVVVDFIGAAKTTPDRYDPGLAFETALPHFQKLRERGVKTLVECTPRYIGRDGVLLRRLSLASGVQIVTNTGWYAAVNHKFLPPEAGTESVEQIAARWLSEWQSGIDGTGKRTTLIRPGFLKLGTGNGPLPPVDAKLVRAAARVHRATGLTIAIHTGDGAAALDEIRLLREEGIAPAALIWVHAMNDPGPIQIEAAKLGAWVSLDGYSLAPRNVIRFADFVAAHREAGTLNRVLLSHDDGWGVDGDAPSGNKLTLFGNGNKSPYEAIFTRLLPDLRAKGFTDADFDQMLVTNPREALIIQRRLIL
jgi:phosphotriesterase-related protein